MEQAVELKGYFTKAEHRRAAAGYARYDGPAQAPRRGSWPRWLVRAAAVLATLAVWQVASAANLDVGISFVNIPTPATVGGELWLLLQTPIFYMHALTSLQRIAVSFVLAAVLGVIIGALMGRSRLFADLILPQVELLRPIPAVAWIPLSILMWPTEESSILFIAFLGAFFPIVLNTRHGVEQTPEVLVKAARSLGADRAAVFRHVVLTAAMPSITTGLAVGMGVSWFSLLAGEIISGQYGIGYFTWSSYTLVEYPKIIIGMIVIGMLGTGSTILVRLATKPLLRWQGERE